MSKLISLIINVFKGMSSFIAAEKLPSAVFQVIENMELTQQFGNLKKRRGYKNILTSGLTSLAGMFEFKDLNGGRQILIQDGTGLEESVYSSGYGAIAAITNDKRTAGSTVSQMYPVEYNRALRSPAGVGSNNYRPFIYQYIAERRRFYDNVTIAAGKYLSETFPSWVDLLSTLVASSLQQSTSQVAAVGLEQGNYALLFSLVLDGSQRTRPFYLGNICKISTANTVITFPLYIDAADQALLERVTAIDVFVASLGDDSNASKVYEYPAYFLERVDMNSNGGEIITINGTFQTASPPTYIDSVADRTAWETFAPEHFWADIVGDTNTYNHVRITAVTLSGGKSHFVFDTTFVNGDSGDSCTIKIYAGWKYNSGSTHRRQILYDNYYRILGTEMYAYLNIPAGDTGLTDYKHKYGTIANNRYFGFGFTDGFAYYTPPYAPDVLCSQNIIRPKKDVVGCVTLGRDVVMFYKEGGSRVTVYSNAQIDQDDDFLNAGCVGMKSIVRLSDNEVVFMGYDGPYLITGRSVQYIGAAIQPWFVITGSLPYLTDAQKEACVAGYNHLKQLIFFSFPTYTTSPYTTGLVFVFDIRAAKLGFEPWWILKTDIPLYSFALADDLHLLAGSTTKIVDFNTQATPDETVSSRILLGMVRNESFAHRHKIMWHKLYVDYTGSDTITLNVYFDKSETPVVLTALNANKETMIGYIKQFFELELTTSASANDLEYSQIEFKALPRNY